MRVYSLGWIFSRGKKSEKEMKSGIEYFTTGNSFWPSDPGTFRGLTLFL